ncbi:hypothetical protein PVK06_036413 [Gossypium arboreum]|uniref:Zinc finger MYM-type protein 1-like n=1 Tax=Gossypium arboreum TaxID=29729 RepID=A0ABR0NJG9_GOSAR|nr:hypothetical protein PVK06_036413 [Gossypium arboreum]
MLESNNDQSIPYVKSSQAPERDIRSSQSQALASNMRGEWNNLQALFAKKCRFAYYVHCLSHRLQLTLVATSKEVFPICQFFSYLIGVINLVASSSKRHGQLRDIKTSHTAELIDSGELETGKRKNQVGTLQHPSDTWWGSHLASLNNLMRMFYSVYIVLQDIIKFGNLMLIKSRNCRKVLQLLSCVKY